MRFTCFMMAMALLPSCRHTEPAEVTLELNKTTRVNDCSVFLSQVTIKPDAAWIKWGCAVPESAPNWWGEGPEPPPTTILEGDCVRFDQKFYCVEDINPESMSVTLKATYEVLHRRVDHLRPVQ